MPTARVLSEDETMKTSSSITASVKRLASLPSDSPPLSLPLNFACILAHTYLNALASPTTFTSTDTALSAADVAGLYQVTTSY